MRRFIMIVVGVVFLCVMASGCKTETGSKEYTPGQGWKSVPE